MGVKVRERKPGEWWVFIDYKGKRKAVKVGTKKAAKKAASDIEGALATGKLNLNDMSMKITFRKYAEKWMDGHVRNNLKAASFRSYRGWLDRYLLPRFGNMEIGEITRADVRGFSHEMRMKGIRSDSVSASSVKTAIIVLSSIFNHAIEDGLIDKNPAERPGRYLKVPDRRGTVEFLTPEEGQTLLETTRRTSPRLYPLILAGLRTGLRQGELIGLQWGDVDFNGKFIEVRRTNFNGHISTPKSGKTRRVDMSDQLVEVLEGLKRKLASESLRWGRPMAEWVFPGDEGAPLEAWYLRKRFSAFLKAAGIRHIPFHSLRHSYSAALIGLGESLAYIQAQLGHHSIQMSVDNYGHLIPGANRKAVNRLDTLGKSATPAQLGEGAWRENAEESTCSSIRKFFNEKEVDFPAVDICPPQSHEQPVPRR